MMPNYKVNNWVCDFCSSPDVIGGYLAPDIVLREYAFGSEGVFAVCAVCKELIDGGKWNALEERSVETFEPNMHMKPAERIFIVEALHKLHQQFRKLRGEFKPIGELVNETGNA